MIYPRIYIPGSQNVFKLTALLFVMAATVPFKDSLFAFRYGVCSEDANYYYICEDVTNEVLGQDYRCFAHPTKLCVIASDQLPDPLTRIPKQLAVIIIEGEFVDLNPNK